jgi:hypothetical protein
MDFRAILSLYGEVKPTKYNNLLRKLLYPEGLYAKKKAAINSTSFVLIFFSHKRIRKSLGRIRSSMSAFVPKDP